MEPLDCETDIGNIREFAIEFSEAVLYGVNSVYSGEIHYGKELEKQKLESSVMMLRQVLWNYARMCDSSKIRI